jgi:hypothetical protein
MKQAFLCGSTAACTIIAERLSEKPNGASHICSILLSVCAEATANDLNPDQGQVG